ncbi:MAG: BatA and WFA domain-containing protein [Planctomycetota bacterium]
MIFSAPIFLFLLPAAALPVIFHLFFKQKKRQVLFPTLMFFHRMDPRLNSRRKIQQFLLLLMRVLLIAFVLLALSRPKFQSDVQMGGKISVVAVVDNSGSMSETAGDDKTKLELAVDGAKRLISSLGESALMNAVTLVEDSAVTFGNSLTSDRESLLSSLDKISPTNATGDAQHALARAFKLLAADSARGGVVHVFSDMQESEWANDALQSVPADAGINVYFHRVGSGGGRQANVAISSIQLPRRKILPRHQLKIGVVCTNNSEATANIRLNSVDNQDNKNTQKIVLEPGRNQVVEVAINPDASGYHWLRTWIEGDGFSADNEAGIGVFCGQTAAVLFSGSQDEFGVLPTAVSPDKYGQFTGMTSKFGRLSQGLEANGEKPILVVATWEEMRQAGTDFTALREYVEGGGNLLIVPSLRRGSAKGQPPAWLGADTKTRISQPRGTKMQVLDRKSDFWNRILEAAESVSLDNISVFSFYPLELSQEFAPILGTDFENVIFAHKSLDEGNIYVSGTAFDPRWNSLPLTGLIVVMTQSIATGGTPFEEDSMVSLVAGEQPRGIDAGVQQVEVRSVLDQEVTWQGRASEMPAFPKAGIYMVNTPDKEYCISVRSSESEGIRNFVQGSQVPALQKVTHEVMDYDPAEDMDKFHYGRSRTFELFLPLVLLATLALLVEGWLANPVRARSEETKRTKGKRAAAQSERASGAAGQPQRQVAVSGGAG